jgi:hypothetical protein
VPDADLDEVIGAMLRHECFHAIVLPWQHIPNDAVIPLLAVCREDPQTWQRSSGKRTVCPAWKGMTTWLGQRMVPASQSRVKAVLG